MLRFGYIRALENGLKRVLTGFMVRKSLVIAGLMFLGALRVSAAGSLSRGSSAIVNATCPVAAGASEGKVCPLGIARLFKDVSGRYLNLTTPEGRKFCATFCAVDFLTVHLMEQWQRREMARGRKIPPVPMAIQLVWMGMVARYMCVGINTVDSLSNSFSKWLQRFGLSRP
jgi:hypothetical protein